MVASRCCWVADGGAVLLENVIRGFHGGAVLLGNGIPGFHGGPVFLDCKWLRALEWWLPGVAGLRMVALCYWRM